MGPCLRAQVDTLRGPTCHGKLAVLPAASFYVRWVFQLALSHKANRAPTPSYHGTQQQGLILALTFPCQNQMLAPCWGAARGAGRGRPPWSYHQGQQEPSVRLAGLGDRS